MRRTAALSILLALVLVGLAAPAGAQVDEAVTAFRDGDTVYVHPDAERRISEGDADRLRDLIRKGDRPVFVAVLPASVLGEVGGNANEMPAHLYDRLGFTGTYAVVAGDSFRAGSTDLGEGRAGRLATKAFQEHRSEGVAAVLLAFVEEVQDAQGGGSGGGGSGLLRTVLILAFLGIVLWAVVASVRRRRAKKEQWRQVEAERGLIRAEVDVLADDVMSLEPVVTLHPDARDEYEEAVARFRFASAALDKVDTIDDLERVRRVVVEGNYAIARAKAVIDGREPPPPPPELAERGKHDEPPVVIEDGRPTYGGVDTGWYGGGGWFGGGGGFLTGILLGDMLGGARWGGGAWGGAGHEGGWSGGGGDFGGGDFGGGDFGGGDFGGGGGDF